MVSYCTAVFLSVGITSKAPTLHKKPKAFLYGVLSYDEVFYLKSCISDIFVSVKILFLEIWSLILCVCACVVF